MSDDTQPDRRRFRGERPMADQPFIARGYRVIARSWPGVESDVGELRRDPTAIAGEQQKEK
jgi:hypothetical protein